MRFGYCSLDVVSPRAVHDELIVEERIQIQIHGEAPNPALIYLPGMHGDWSLISSFRAALSGRVRLVEITYPPTTEWNLDRYADAVTDALAASAYRSR